MAPATILVHNVYKRRHKTSVGVDSIRGGAHRLTSLLKASCCALSGQLKESSSSSPGIHTNTHTQPARMCYCVMRWEEVRWMFVFFFDVLSSCA